MTEPFLAQSGPYKVALEVGKKYAWCSCGLSNKQPFCDGNHKNTYDLKPIVFESESETVAYLCGCKQTKDVPYCDGTHKEIGS